MVVLVHHLHALNAAQRHRAARENAPEASTPEQSAPPPPATQARQGVHRGSAAQQESAVPDRQPMDLFEAEDVCLWVDVDPPRGLKPTPSGRAPFLVSVVSGVRDGDRSDGVGQGRR
ncbi:hypothetical protein SPI_09399 [Niveomyces insectorum RCEF 264]|uniref:Uncharacterized protein n=1 Tax=Niveomyces insectorum RCEF 264 TaxID=1081102 RepID=A0A167LT43_9HYPO|nr:hypothetical protein SPI_09399 [Niveomyces insectorum RCEF 264]